MDEIRIRIEAIERALENVELSDNDREEIDEFLVDAEYHIQNREYWYAKDNIGLAEAKLETLGIKVKP